MIEEVHHGAKMLASFTEPGIHFCTENDASQTIAFMRHPKGKEIVPHVGNPVERTVTDTQETFFIRKGSLRVDFYTQEKEYLEGGTLTAGDAILLIAGEHGFEAMDDLEMIEVKQGPDVGDADKVRFERPA
jgi:mannose-6-phosphate isomerase-like protein (cupin superfamily)